MVEIKELSSAAAISMATEALSKHREAAELATDAKALKEEANALIEVIMLTEDTQSVQIGGMGRITKSVSVKKKFDKKAFKLDLVKNGVAATLIAGAEEAATTSSAPIISYRYFPWEQLSEGKRESH